MRIPPGNRGVIYPGLAQRMSAGSGILHSERNDSSIEPVHFVPMRAVPEETGIRPGCPVISPGATPSAFADADGPRVSASKPSELLIWEMHVRLGGQTT